MGGNALKDVDVVRLPARLYTVLAERVVARLTDGVLFPGLQGCAIPALRAKADYGDLDVLVSHPVQGWGWNDHAQARLRDAFMATQMVQNGPVVSFDVGVPPDPQNPEAPAARFQVDLIQVPSAIFPFALRYYSYNDLGNLLGRVARLHGFKLGHAGLFRPFRAPGNASHFVRDILVTRDWSAALTFLGYDPDRWAQGFDTREEMFAFVANSKAFHPSAFPLEHRSHKARVRDRKRPTYTAFLQWLADRGLTPSEPLADATRVVMEGWGLSYALDQFEPFLRAWVQAQTDLQATQVFRARFNGEAVSRLTGLAGPALGHHMAALRERFDTDQALRVFVREASEADLATFMRAGMLPADSHGVPHVGDGSRAAGEESV